MQVFGFESPLLTMLVVEPMNAASDRTTTELLRPVAGRTEERATEERTATADIFELR